MRRSTIELETRSVSRNHPFPTEECGHGQPISFRRPCRKRRVFRLRRLYRLYRRADGPLSRVIPLLHFSCGWAHLSSREASSILQAICRNFASVMGIGMGRSLFSSSAKLCFGEVKVLTISRLPVTRSGRTDHSQEMSPLGIGHFCRCVTRFDSNLTAIQPVGVATGNCRGHQWDVLPIVVLNSRRAAWCCPVLSMCAGRWREIQRLARNCRARLLTDVPSKEAIRNCSPNETAADPRGISRIACVFCLGTINRHGGTSHRVSTTRPAVSSMTRSIANPIQQVWIEEQGTRSKPVPCGSCLRNCSPFRRGQNQSATSNRSTTIAPVEAFCSCKFITALPVGMATRRRRATGKSDRKPGREPRS